MSQCVINCRSPAGELMKVVGPFPSRDAAERHDTVWEDEQVRALDSP